MMNRPADLQKVITDDLYANPQPTIDGVKQVLDTLKNRIQALTPSQMQVIGYLRYLQSRPLHNGQKPYEGIIEHIQNEAHRVAPPGFFVRVIEALIPRPISVDSKTYDKMRKESDAKR